MREAASTPFRRSRWATPETDKKFPVVLAKVTLNAYSFSAPAPQATTPPSTSTDSSSNGTVAVGATP